MKRKLLVGGLLLFTFASTVIAQHTPGEFPWQVGRHAGAPAHGDILHLPATGIAPGITQLMICDASGRSIAIVDAVVYKDEVVATLPKGIQGTSYRILNSKASLR